MEECWQLFPVRKHRCLPSIWSGRGPRIPYHTCLADALPTSSLRWCSWCGQLAPWNISAIWDTNPWHTQCAHTVGQHESSEIWMSNICITYFVGGCIQETWRQGTKSKHISKPRWRVGVDHIVGPHGFQSECRTTTWKTNMQECFFSSTFTQLQIQNRIRFYSCSSLLLYRICKGS